MCDCHSYNGQTGSTPEVVATPPWSNKTVCLDACIADATQLLWSLGYVTAGFGVKDNFCVNVIKANTIPATGDKE